MQQEATVNGQEATIKAARADIANAKTAETRTEVLIEFFTDLAPPRAKSGLKVSNLALAPAERFGCGGQAKAPAFMYADHCTGKRTYSTLTRARFQRIPRCGDFCIRQGVPWSVPFFRTAVHLLGVDAHDDDENDEIRKSKNDQQVHGFPTFQWCGCFPEEAIMGRRPASSSSSFVGLGRN